MMTIRDAAEACELSEGYIRRAIASHEIGVLMCGNRQLVDEDEVKRLAAKRGDGITIGRLSDETGLSPSAIRRGIQEGWLPYTRSGRRFYFDLDAVSEAIKQRMR